MLIMLYSTINVVAVSGSTYNYTVGIDRVDASLLCDPNDDSIYLGGLMWGIVDGVTLTNPINMSEWSNTLDQQTYQLNCPSVGNEFITVNTNIYCESIMHCCYSPTFHIMPIILSYFSRENSKDTQVFVVFFSEPTQVFIEPYVQNKKIPNILKFLKNIPNLLKL